MIDSLWNNTVAFAACARWAKRRITTARGIVLWPALVLASACAGASEQAPCPGIHLEVKGIGNGTGSIACALFDSPQGFPTEFLEFATHLTMVQIQNLQARCDFLGVAAGNYALAIVHDENKDGKLGVNWLGVPGEGYGFSNGAKALMSAPSFEDASFSYDGQSLDLTIELQY